MACAIGEVWKDILVGKWTWCSGYQLHPAFSRASYASVWALNPIARSWHLAFFFVICAVEWDLGRMLLSNHVAGAMNTILVELGSISWASCQGFGAMVLERCHIDAEILSLKVTFAAERVAIQHVVCAWVMFFSLGFMQSMPQFKHYLGGEIMIMRISNLLFPWAWTMPYFPTLPYPCS